MRAKIIHWWLFVFLLFGFVCYSFGYDTKTHAYLTDVIVDFYNQHFPQKRIEEDIKRYLIEGAVREDDVPRFMNHFYDPVYKRGLSYDPKIDFINYGNWEPSKEWAQDETNQNYALYKARNFLAFILSVFEVEKLKESTNFTWQNALRLYKEGRKEEAFFALGHIIHLIEDASVPDHTRNDAHADGSPFERWTARFNLSSPDLNLANRLKNKKPIILDTLDDYFDGIATYSNNNFFSKDTIGVQTGYNLPQVDLANTVFKNSKYYILHKDAENNEYFLVVKNSSRGSILGWKDISFSINDSLVLSSYWNLLSTKAVEYGAGVIHLFFKEIEKEVRKEGNENSASLISLLNYQGDTFSGESNKNEINKQTQLLDKNGAHDQKESKSLNLIVYTDKTVVKPGDNLILNGINFTPLGVVEVNIERGGQIIKTFNVSANKEGSWSFVFSIPQDSKEGNYNFYALDKSTNQKSATLVYSVLREIKELSSADVVSKSTTTLNQPNNNVALEKNRSSSSNQINKQAQLWCSFDVNLKASHFPLLINEVAWMGGSESYGLNASREWIELRNLTGNVIDLAGYQLLSKRGNIKITFPSGAKIESNGYFLLERTDDNSVPYIPADFIYVGGLANSDDGLALFDKNCQLIDLVVADPDWPAGDASLKRTMERKDDLSWYTSGSFNGTVFGTPRFPNGPQYVYEGRNQSNVIYVGGSSSNTNSNSSSNSQIPQLMINEIMYDYPGSDNGYEWVEVKNIGNVPIDVSSLKFFENDISHGLVKVLGDNIIPPGGFFVIANGTSTFLSQYPDFSGNLFYSSFSLNNNGEELALRYGNQIFGNIFYDVSRGAKGNGFSLQLINGSWEESLPTPGKENVFNKSTQGDYPSQNSITGNLAQQLVISEVRLGGEDPGDEFIEIYNPTDRDISLEGFSLQYISGNADVISSSTVYKKNFISGNIVKAHRFFLVARGLNDQGEDGYKGIIPPDLTYRSFSLSSNNAGGAVLLVATTSLISSFSDEYIINALFYGQGSIFASSGLKTINLPPLGGSLQRKAFKNGKCISGLVGEEGEFLPKACVTGMSDTEFEISTSSRPQNSQSLSEPRFPPNTPLPLNNKNSIAFYNYDEAKIHFTWQASKDGDGSPSLITYKIFSLDENGNKFLVTTTSLLEFDYTLSEIGKKYSFEIYACDRDGMCSLPSKLAVDTPFLSEGEIIFQNGVFSDFSSGSHYSDNWYNLGRGFSGTLQGLTLKGYVEYQKVPVEIILQEFEDKDYTNLLNSFVLTQDSVFETYVTNVKISGLNIELHPFSYYRLFTRNSYQNRSVILLGTTAKGKAMKNSFVYGVGRVEEYYTFYPFMLMEGVKGPAFDFSVPQPPTKPSFTAFDFDKINLKLTLHWSTSTDLDSLDSKITYEINYTPFSNLNSNEWINVGSSTTYAISLAFPNQYTIGIRAVDDEGVYSEEAISVWNFPEGFRPYILSGSYNKASQDFTLNRNIVLKTISIYTSSFSTQSGNPFTNICFLNLEEVLKDGSVVTVSSPDNSFSGPQCEGKLTFDFSSSLPHLEAGRTYRWTFSIPLPSYLPQPTVKFYGRNDNIVGGLFSGGDIKNAAFEIEGDQGEMLNLENW